LQGKELEQDSQCACLCGKVQASSWVSRRITWANSDIGAGALGPKDSLVQKENAQSEDWRREKS